MKVTLTRIAPLNASGDPHTCDGYLSEPIAQGKPIVLYLTARGGGDGQAVLITPPVTEISDIENGSVIWTGDSLWFFQPIDEDQL